MEVAFSLSLQALKLSSFPVISIFLDLHFFDSLFTTFPASWKACTLDGFLSCLELPNYKIRYLPRLFKVNNSYICLKLRSRALWWSKSNLCYALWICSLLVGDSINEGILRSPIWNNAVICIHCLFSNYKIQITKFLAVTYNKRAPVTFNNSTRFY